MIVPFEIAGDIITRPNNLIHETLSIGLPFTIIGAKTGSHLAKDIRNFLAFTLIQWKFICVRISIGLSRQRLYHQS